MLSAQLKCGSQTSDTDGNVQSVTGEIPDRIGERIFEQ